MTDKAQTKLNFISNLLSTHAKLFGSIAIILVALLGVVASFIASDMFTPEIASHAIKCYKSDENFLDCMTNGHEHDEDVSTNVIPDKKCIEYLEENTALIFKISKLEAENYNMIEENMQLISEIHKKSQRIAALKRVFSPEPSYTGTVPAYSRIAPSAPAR